MSKKSKARRLMENFMSYLRYGGATYVTIAKVNAGERLKGKTALVTGGSSGIGKGIASKFLEEGARVIITGRRIETLEIAKNELNSPKLFTVQGDIADLQSMESCFDACVEIAHGKIDVLVNNAGVHTEEKLSSMTEQEWDRVVDTNLKGLYFLCKRYVGHLLSKKMSGKIINMSSIWSILGHDGPYGLSKAGVDALTRGLAKEYLPHGIIVNSILPGNTVSNITQRDVTGSLYSKSNANGRLLLPGEIADLALYLASDTANGIVGQTIVIDGGTTL